MKEKKSVLIGWVCSYVIILIIPIIAIFINYAYSYNVVKKETIQANELILDNMTDSIDRYLQKEISFYAFFLGNEAFQSAISRLDKNAQFYYDIARVLKQIENYNSYGLRLSCLIYISDKDYVIGNGRANDSRYYYDALKTSRTDIGEYEDWMQIVNAEYRTNFLLGDCFSNETKGNSVVYANSVIYSGHEKVNFLISIPVEILKEIAKPLAPGTNLVINLKDEEMIVLSNDGEQEVSGIIRETCLENRENTYETDEYIGIRKSSDISKVEYHLLIPKGEFWKETIYIRNVLCISVSVTLLVGFLCVYMLSKRNFKPVSDLVAKTVGDRGKGNEFKLIENAYVNLRDENHSMYQRIALQTEIVQSNYLLAIMKGRTIDKKDTIISLQPGQKIALVGISVPLCDENQIRHDELMLFVADNIFSELMGEDFFYRIEEGYYLLYLFLIDGNEQRWKTNCMQQASNMCDMMMEKWEVPLIIAVSGMDTELDNIRFLYKDVIETFKGMKLLGRTGAFDTEMRYQSEAGKKGMMQSITEYVQAHYTDINLNITTIADSIGRNPKYVSRVFKEEGGENILDYINRMKIERALALIHTGQFTLEQVSEMVGYASVRTFRRAFIKIVGVNPGKYMEDRNIKEEP